MSNLVEEIEEIEDDDSNNVNKMNSIYDEMFYRNYNWLLNNEVVYDPLLMIPNDDNRKCIALVINNTIEILDNNIFTINKTLKNNYIIPQIHSTFIVLKGWSTDKINWSQEDSDKIRSILVDNIIPYEITFDRLISVKSGLTLVGNPSIDVNKVRDIIREEGYETNTLYKCDIVHITIMRWINRINSVEKLKWMYDIYNMSRKTYARVNVNSFNIVLASWTMKPSTIKILDTINL